MGRISTIFFFDGDNSPGTCLNHIGPIYLHVKDDWEENDSLNTEESRARFFFVDSYTCLESSTYSQVKDPEENLTLQKGRRLAFRFFNGATPFVEGVRFIDSKLEKAWKPDRSYYVRVSSGAKFPINKPYTYSANYPLATVFPTMRSNTNNMWFATNYIFDMKSARRSKATVYPPRASSGPLVGDQRSDRKPGDRFGDEWFLPLNPPGVMTTTRMQDKSDMYYCTDKNRERLVTRDSKYTGTQEAFDVFAYVPSINRHDADTTQRVPYDPRNKIPTADAKRALWSIGSYNGGQWQLGLDEDADPLDSEINGYGSRCMRQEKNADGDVTRDNRVGDTKCWAWHEHHHMISNRMSLCEFDWRSSSIRCRSIREPNKMRCEKDALADTGEQYLEGQDVDDDADIGDFPLTGELQYPSWDDIGVYMDAKNHAYNLFSDANAADTMDARKPTQVTPVLKPYGRVGFLLLPTDPMYHCLLIAPKSLADNCIDGGWRSVNHFLPTATKIATVPVETPVYARLYGVNAENPMGQCPHACSTGNPRMCAGPAGRCFCPPSKDSMATGLGCEQKINRSTVSNTTCAFWRDRGVDICSEAGECVDNTADGWPMCRCFGKFRGTPDQHKWKAVYAGLFGRSIRSSAANANLGSAGLADSWISTDITGLRSTFVFSDGRVSSRISASEVIVDWTEYVASHQCLIWTASITEPVVRWRVNWNAYRDWSKAHAESYLESLSNVAIAYPDDEDRSDRLVYPWPLAAVADQSGLTLMSNGLQCADYKDTSFVDFSDPISQLSLFKTWRLDPYLKGVTLFGGEACLPCPDCNRATSVCADRPEDLSKPAENRTTYCKCNDNFAGPLCQIAVCPGFSNSTFCGGAKRGSCPGYTNTTYPMLTTQQLASSATIVGATLAQCQCTQGWSGTECSVPLCPVDGDGNICGSVFENLALNRSSSRGYCDTTAGRCVCGDDWTGPDCSIPRCPVEPATGRECAGLTWYNNASRSVCDRTTRTCECWRALEVDFAADMTSTYLDGDQNPVLDASIYLNGRYGSACESTYSSQCMTEDGTWCGKVLGCETTACNRRFAGCSILGCPGRAAGTAASCGVGAGSPQCYCRPGFEGPRCETSVCGQYECDNPNGQDTGQCVVTCGKTEPGSLCNMLLVSKKNITQTGTCECLTTPDGIRWTTNGTDLTCNVPVPSACIQYPGADVCSGETSGSCLRNRATQAFQCYCQSGFSGTHCQTGDACGGGACNTNGRRCARGATRNTCVCKNNYLYEADGSACTNERCVSTGGVITSLDEENCQCPDGRPMTVTYDALYLPDNSVNFEVHKGCRKKCPVHPTTKVECGAFPVRRPWPMCGDIVAGTPVWANSASPAWVPGCTCNFLSPFTSNYYMFWESDGVRGCMPKCSLENSRGVQYATKVKGSFTVRSGDDVMSQTPGTLVSSDFKCECKEGWQGDTCTERRCTGQASEVRISNPNTGALNCSCAGTKWCYFGDSCQLDYCAPEGFCFERNDQTATNADCNCKLPAYGVQQSPLLQRGRRCASLCQNGGTPLITGPRSAVCVCPTGFFGTYCETKIECPPSRPQWGGPECKTRMCQNRGQPLENAPGCDCVTRYLTGMLCDGPDLCTANNGVLQIWPDRTCTCNPGWDKPVGDTDGLCIVNKCSAYGQPIDCRDTNCPGGYMCSCAPGWAFNGLTCAYIGSQLSYCNPTYGRLRNVSSVDLTLGVMCVCKDGFGGDGCATYLCNPYEVPTGPGTCGCIYPFEGAECVNDFCPPNSVGPKRVLGINGTLTSDFECECAVGYRLVKPTGRPQCIPDVTNCNPQGTLDWSPTVPLAECKCKTDWTGRGCFTSVASAAYLAEMAVRIEAIEALEREKEKDFNEAFVDAWTTPNLNYAWFFVGLVLTGLAIWRWTK